MPKSFRIGWVQTFVKKGDSHRFDPQLTLNGIPSGAETSVHSVGKNILTSDFQPFVIDHQFTMERWARFDGHWVPNFITRGEIEAYHSPSRKLLLLSGQRDVVDDFCRTYGDSDRVKFTTVQVDMNALLRKLPEVNLAWFRFPAGKVKASALMGHKIEGTRQFKEATATADISTLSFDYEIDTARNHGVTVTARGSIILSGKYQDSSAELAVVLDVYEQLVQQFCAETPMKKRNAVTPSPESNSIPLLLGADD